MNNFLILLSQCRVTMTTVGPTPESFKMTKIQSCKNLQN